MKTPKLSLVATLAAAALVLSACGSDKDSGGSASGDNADIKLCMYTHGDGGAFWSVAKKGAEKAADDLGIKFDYQESNNDPAKQASLIEAGVDSGCQGIAVSAPNPDAIKGALAKATAKDIPIVTMNSGSDVFAELGALTHVGPGRDSSPARRRARSSRSSGVDQAAVPDPGGQQHRSPATV